MTRRTRYFMLGSGLIVAMGIGTGLVAYYNGDLPLLRSRVGPDELAYVPAEATGVAYANVREIMDSEFRQKLRQVLPTGEGKDELFQETGIDIERDIDSVVAASIAGPPDKNGIVLIRGRFDEGRIETLARQHGAVVSDYNGKRLIGPPANGTGTSQTGPCIAFLEAGLLAIGNDVSLKKAIDTRATRANVTNNAEMMKFITQLDGGGNTAWAVGGFDEMAKNASLPQQVRDNLPAVQWFAVSAHIDGGVNGHVRAEARDDQAGENLRAVVNGALAAARLVGGKDAKLDALVNSLQISGTGKNVDLAFTVSPDVLDVINGVAGLKHLQEQHPQHPQK